MEIKKEKETILKKFSDEDFFPFKACSNWNRFLTNPVIYSVSRGNKTIFRCVLKDISATHEVLNE